MRRFVAKCFCVIAFGLGGATGSMSADWPGFPPSVSAPSLTKVSAIYGSSTYETTPIVFQGKPLLYATNSVAMSLSLKDLGTGEVISTFGTDGDGYSLGSAFVSGDQINVFAAKYSTTDWTQDIYRFTSTDGKNWTNPTLAVARSNGEHLFNSSVCWDGRQYVMAYESNQPMQWSTKFARSADLATWEKMDVPTFLGAPGTEGANPTLRYVDNYYYLLYSTFWPDGRSGWVTYLARSQNLTDWEFSDQEHPVLEPSGDEGINNSDPDLFEYNGKTYMFYASGYQTTEGTYTKLAVYDGSMSQFLSSYFPAAVPEPGCWSLLMIAAGAVSVHRCLRWKKTRVSVGGA